MKNHYEIKGDVTLIFIRFKGDTLITLIDTADLEIADSFPGTWAGSQYQEGGQIYVTGTNAVNRNIKSWKLHRLIAGIDGNNEYIVDHYNRVGLDNRRDNLIKCTLAENAQNLSLSKNSTSGHRGVSYKKDKRKWKAYYGANKKQVHVGYFETKEEAAEAAKQARIKNMKFSNEAI